MAYALVGFQSFYELWPPQNHLIHHKHSTIFFSVVFKLIQTDVNEVLNDLKLRDYNGSGSIINYSHFVLLFKNMNSLCQLNEWNGFRRFAAYGRDFFLKTV